MSFLGVDQSLGGRRWVGPATEITRHAEAIAQSTGLPDALCYYLVWFIRGRYSKGPEFLSQFRRLVPWEECVKAIGHGRPADMDSKEALAVAKAATPETPETGDDDPTGLKPGDEVTVEPIGIGLPNAVTGRIVRIGAQEIAIARADEQVGDVVVHFPRVG